jgi:hypothetical protein
MNNAIAAVKKYPTAQIPKQFIIDQTGPSRPTEILNEVFYKPSHSGLEAKIAEKFGIKK